MPGHSPRHSATRPTDMIKPRPLEGTPHDVCLPEASFRKSESGRWLARSRRKFRGDET